MSRAKSMYFQALSGQKWCAAVAVAVVAVVVVVEGQEETLLFRKTPPFTRDLEKTSRGWLFTAAPRPPPSNNKTHVFRQDMVPRSIPTRGLFRLVFTYRLLVLFLCSVSCSVSLLLKQKNTDFYGYAPSPPCTVQKLILRV